MVEAAVAEAGVVANVDELGLFFAFITFVYWLIGPLTSPDNVVQRYGASEYNAGAKAMREHAVLSAKEYDFFDREEREKRWQRKTELVETAERNFRRAVALRYDKGSPRGHADVLSEIGRGYVLRGKTLKATKLWREVVDIHPHAAPIVYNQAVALAMVGLNERAVSSYNHLLNGVHWMNVHAVRIPDEVRLEWKASAHQSMSRMLVEAGRLDDALLEADDAVQAQTAMAVNVPVAHASATHYHRGQILARLGKRRAAAKAFKACTTGRERPLTMAMRRSIGRMQPIHKFHRMLCFIELGLLFEQPRRMKADAAAEERRAAREQRVRTAIGHYASALLLRQRDEMWFPHSRIRALREELDLLAIGRRRRILQSAGYGVVDLDGFVVPFVVPPQKKQRKESASSAAARGDASTAAATALDEGAPASARGDGVCDEGAEGVECGSTTLALADDESPDPEVTAVADEAASVAAPAENDSENDHDHADGTFGSFGASDSFDDFDDFDGSGSSVEEAASAARRAKPEGEAFQKAAKKAKAAETNTNTTTMAEVGDPGSDGQKGLRCFSDGVWERTMECEVYPIGERHVEPEGKGVQYWAASNLPLPKNGLRGGRLRGWGAASGDAAADRDDSDAVNERAHFAGALRRRPPGVVLLPMASRFEIGKTVVSAEGAKPPVKLLRIENFMRRERDVLGTRDVAERLADAIVTSVSQDLDFFRDDEKAKEEEGYGKKKKKKTKKQASARKAKRKTKVKRKSRKLRIFELGCEKALLGHALRRLWDDEIDTLDCSNFATQISAQNVPAKWEARDVYGTVRDVALLTTLKVQALIQKLDIIMTLDSIPALANLEQLFIDAATALRAGGLFAFASVRPPRWGPAPQAASERYAVSARVTSHTRCLRSAPPPLLPLPRARAIRSIHLRSTRASSSTTGVYEVVASKTRSRGLMARCSQRTCLRSCTVGRT
jgi:tetratricopeptide (TPR) repeat protein